MFSAQRLFLSSLSSSSLSQAFSPAKEAVVYNAPKPLQFAQETMELDGFRHKSNKIVGGLGKLNLLGMQFRLMWFQEVILQNLS